MAKLENKTKENPKLEQNKLSDGRISLYLEYYLGREEKPVLDENGNQVYYESGKMQGNPKFAVKHHRRKEKGCFSFRQHICFAANRNRFSLDIYKAIN